MFAHTCMQMVVDMCVCVYAYFICGVHTSVNINSTYTKCSPNRRYLKSATEVVQLKIEQNCRRTLSASLSETKPFIFYLVTFLVIYYLTVKLILTGLFLQN